MGSLPCNIFERANEQSRFFFKRRAREPAAFHCHQGMSQAFVRNRRVGRDDGVDLARERNFGNVPQRPLIEVGRDLDCERNAAFRFVT